MQRENYIARRKGYELDEAGRATCEKGSRLVADLRATGHINANLEDAQRMTQRSAISLSTVKVPILLLISSEPFTWGSSTVIPPKCPLYLGDAGSTNRKLPERAAVLWVHDHNTMLECLTIMESWWRTLFCISRREGRWQKSWSIL